MWQHRTPEAIIKKSRQPVLSLSKDRCKDECLPEETNRRIVDIISDVNMAYSEHARRYLADTGLPKERTYVTGSPMAEPTRERVQYQAAA